MVLYNGFIANKREKKELITEKLLLANRTIFPTLQILLSFVNIYQINSKQQCEIA